MGEMELHDFLVNQHDELSSAARQIPKLREHINEMRSTAATFRLNKWDDVTAHILDSIHVEFLKAWPVHANYTSSSQRGRQYVNPNYTHASTYTDVLIDCECGAIVNRNNDRGEVEIQGEHDHTEECLPQWRLSARAQAHELKRRRILRLTRLGWRGNEISPRIGLTHDHISSLCREYHLSLEDLRERYRKIAGRTYAYLVRQHGESGADVAEVYGHQRNTLSRWATERTDFESSRELTRVDGQFAWVEPSTTKRPEFLQ